MTAVAQFISHVRDDQEHLALQILAAVAVALEMPLVVQEVLALL